MDCHEFLTLHSEYIDERLSAEDADRCRVHAAMCGACERYDHIIRRGQELLRQLPEPKVSPEFQTVLEYRLSHVREEAVGGRGAGTGAVLSLAIAAVLALAAWGPLLRADRERESTASLAVELPARGAPLDAVLHAPDWFDAPSVAGAFGGTAPHTRHASLAFPGPYTPLVIMPPVVQRTRGAVPSVRLTSLE